MFANMPFTVLGLIGLVIVLFVVIVGFVGMGIGRLLSKATMKPIMQAAVDGDMEKVTELLDGGEDVNVKTATGETALIFAASHGHPEVVGLLLDRGADINRKVGMTALRHAIEKDDIETAKLLSDRGADVNTAYYQDKTFTGIIYTPLVDAIKKSNLDMTKMLLDHGAEPSPSALLAAVHVQQISDPSVLSSRLEIAKLLIAKGVNVNVSPANRDTALHYAVDAKNVEMVKLLISCGANVNAPGSHGHRPLIGSNNKEVTELLEQAGAK